jgi:NTE family protein
MRAIKGTPATKKITRSPRASKPVLTNTPPNNSKKKINIALQGGGAHGAFAWGILDKFLEDGRVEIEGISGTSAGSMNAVVFASGMIKGPDGAREALHNFWKKISDAGEKYSMVKLTPIEKMMGKKIEDSFLNQFFKMVIHNFSPYELNPMDFNPLKEVLESCVDFEELEKHAVTKLFIATTNVRTGKAKVFESSEVTSDVVLASACLPFLFKAVNINGENYWDGGYMGNPVLYPLIYNTVSKDIVIVHINPIERLNLPKTADEIANRVNEITFNTSLIKELRAIHFVQKMLESNMLKDEYKKNFKNVLMHSIRADTAMSDLSVTSKLHSDWEFLQMLRDRGRTYAADWLNENFKHLNNRSSVDLEKEFL